MWLQAWYLFRASLLKAEHHHCIFVPPLECYARFDSTAQQFSVGKQPWGGFDPNLTRSCA
jgi:hypothetical protein